MPHVAVRPMTADDRAAIRHVHQSAFPTPAESLLVDLVIDRGKAVISLIATADGQVAGHVLFSPVSVERKSHTRGLGLAPVAVLPLLQNRGIGARLVEAGIAACRAAGYSFVVVLGEPALYGRFGFRRASDFGLANEYDADDAFMTLELTPGGIPCDGGLVRYAPEFAEVFPGPEK